MRKALVAAVLGSLLLLVSPAPAYAHADLVRSSPANGSVAAQAPSSIRLTFSEPVTLESSSLLDAGGHALAARASLEDSVLTVTPQARLSAGITVVTFSITSDDGHVVNGAISFLIGKPSATGAPQSISTAPVVRTKLSGSQPGRLTAAFARKATSGEVIWTSPSLTGSLTWPVHASGKGSAAVGVLPFAGVWTMRATLISPTGTIVITSGTATLNS